MCVVDTGMTSDNHRAMPTGEPASPSDTATRWEALGLFDPEAPDAAGTLEVLRFYESVGVVAADYVGVEPAQVIPEINLRTFTTRPSIDRESAQRASGLTTDEFADACRVIGYDARQWFTDTDVAAITGLVLASEMFTPAELEPLIRVLRSLMSQLADALTALYRIDVSVPMDVAGARQIDHARKNYEAAQLLRHVPIVLESFLMHEMTAAVRRSDQSRQQVTSTNTAAVKMAVGFVDIVGYTPLADQLPPDELGQFIVDFERRASEAVTAHGGRIVKLIGDEVMYVVVDPDAAFDIARALIDAFDGSETTPRAGVAYGEMVARGGDYYGRLVNIASRIGDLAIPGEVLTDGETADAAKRTAFVAAGRRMLRGIAEPVELRSLAPD